MKFFFRKNIINIGLLSLLYLSVFTPESLSQEITQNNNSTEVSSTNTTIPSLIFTGLGILIGLTVTTMIIILEPKSLSVASETFVLKQKNVNEDSQTLRLSNLFGLTYNFGDFMEIQPAISISSNMPNLYLLDLGIKINNSNIINNERFGLSPFISLGLNANAYSLVNLGYGFYAKTGFTLKFDKLLIDVLVGYRAMETSLANINSLTFGGNIGYKF